MTRHLASVHDDMRLNAVAGRNIARLRRRKGLSQAELAAKTGITQQYISGLESGLRNLSLATLEKIADALGVEPAELLDRRVAEKPGG